MSKSTVSTPCLAPLDHAIFGDCLPTLSCQRQGMQPCSPYKGAPSLHTMYGFAMQVGQARCCLWRRLPEERPPCCSVLGQRGQGQKFEHIQGRVSTGPRLKHAQPKQACPAAYRQFAAKYPAVLAPLLSTIGSIYMLMHVSIREQSTSWWTHSWGLVVQGRPQFEPASDICSTSAC